jgi:hypothetical protein
MYADEFIAGTDGTGTTKSNTKSPVITGAGQAKPTTSQQSMKDEVSK